MGDEYVDRPAYFELVPERDRYELRPDGGLRNIGGPGYAASGGCNEIRGRCRWNDREIRCESQECDLAYGGPLVGPQEEAFQEALRAMATYRIDGGTLAIMDADGRVLAKFGKSRHLDDLFRMLKAVF